MAEFETLLKQLLNLLRVGAAPRLLTHMVYTYLISVYVV